MTTVLPKHQARPEIPASKTCCGREISSQGIDRKPDAQRQMRGLRPDRVAIERQAALIGKQPDKAAVTQPLLDKPAGQPDKSKPRNPGIGDHLQIVKAHA